MHIELRPDGRSLHDLIESVMIRVRNSGKLIAQTLQATTRNHFTTIYPGSKHYSPSKVFIKDSSNGDVPSGTIKIDVPGITRAFHDVHILPIKRKYLTIPIHRRSYGKRCSEITDELFYIDLKTKGKYLVARGGEREGLVFLYRLRQYVRQKRDERLLPKPKVYADNITSRLLAYLRADNLA